MTGGAQATYLGGMVESVSVFMQWEIGEGKEDIHPSDAEALVVLLGEN